MTTILLRVTTSIPSDIWLANSGGVADGRTTTKVGQLLGNGYLNAYMYQARTLR